MGLEVRKGKTVDGGLKERIGCALIYNSGRVVRVPAARRQQMGIDRISGVDAARGWAAARAGASRPWLVLNPHRPSRYEPRVRKRRPKQSPLMQHTRQTLRKALANKTEMD